MSGKLKSTLLLLLALVTTAVAIFLYDRDAEKELAPEELLQTVRFGITPFQDSALPVVAKKKGWYREKGLDVEVVDLGWTDVPLGLASNSIDVAIYNFDSFMASWHQLNSAGKPLVFYAPLYTWNGAAIMVSGNAGYETMPEGTSTVDATEHLAAVMKQLQGKRIGITRGTTFEQTVLDALAKAGMKQSDVELVHARPEDNLAAFLAGSLDAFSAGLTERVQAKRHGAIELVIGPDVSVPVVDGLVATQQFAKEHPDVMQNLINVWFASVNYVGADPANNSNDVRDYLRTRASVDYSAEEYAIAWTFQYFPQSREEAADAFFSPNSRYYWKPIWDSNIDYLLSNKKIPSTLPESAFGGEEALSD